MEILDIVERLQVQNEELEKRLKALSLVTTPSAQLDQLNLAVLDMRNILSSLYTSFSEFAETNDNSETRQLVIELEDKFNNLKLQTETTLSSLTSQVDLNKTSLEEHISTFNEHLETYNAFYEEFRKVAYFQVTFLSEKVTELDPIVKENKANIQENTTKVTSSLNQISNLNQHVASLLTRVENIEQAGGITNGGVDFSEQISGLQDEIDYMGEQYTSLSNQISTLSTNQIEHENESVNVVAGLENQIALLDNKISDKNSAIETTHFIQRCTCKSVNKATYYNYLYSRPISFSIVPTCEVTVKATVTGYSSSPPTSNCNIALCDAYYPTNPIAITKFNYTSNFTQEVSYSFMPTKPIYTFNVFTNTGASTFITEIKWEVSGRNPNVYMGNDVSIVMFNNKYYITKMNNNGNPELLIQTPETVNLNETGTEYQIQEAPTEDYTFLALAPSASIDSNNCLQYDESTLVGYAIKKTTNILTGKVTEGTTFQTIAMRDMRGPKAMMCMSAQTQAGIVIGVIGSASTICSGISDSYYIKYNSSNINGVVYCCPVFNNYLSVTDQPREFYGIIINEADGTNYFYQKIQNTTRIELPKGKNATAFLQPETKNIHVYINQFNKVKKYVLIYGTDKTYTLSADEPEEFLGVEEILEGYSGQYFAKINGKYEVKTFS